MSLIEFVNEVFFALVEGVIILLLYLYLLDKKEFIKLNKFKTVIYILLFTVFSYYATRYLIPGLHTVFHIIFLISVLSYITQSNIYSSVVAVAVYSIFVTTIEIIVISVGASLFKVDFTSYSNTPILKLVFLVVSRVLQLGVIFLLYIKRIRIFRVNILRKEYSSIAFFLFHIVIITPLIIAASFIKVDQDKTLEYNIIIACIFILFVLFNIYDYRDRDKMLKINHKFILQEEYVKNIESVIDIVRREKHDFSNHLNTILALCTIKKPDALERIEEYIRKLTNNFQSSYRFYNSGSDYIDGLLAVKSNLAFENGINMVVNFDVPLNEADIEDSDLISIIGNIVDNAFEAIGEGDDLKRKEISIYTYTEQGKYYISIANSGVPIPERRINKIFENGFSTKPNSCKDRGYGLFITKQLVKRNSGKISVSSVECETEFLIELNVKDKDRVGIK